MTRIVIGFDPGVAPAAAAYGGPEFIPMLFPPMGVARVTTGGKKRNDPDISAILAVLDAYLEADVVIENISTMPGQGIASAGRFLFARGLLEGLATGRNHRVINVTPQKIRSYFKMPAGEKTSRQLAVKRFPQLAKFLAKAGSHNEADALFMAIWAWETQ